MLTRLAAACACLLASWSLAQGVTFHGTGGIGIDIGHGGGKAWAVSNIGKVYRFDTPPGAWTEISGITTAARIDVDSRGNPWVVTRDRKVFTWNGGWQQVPGDILEVGRSTTGDRMWALGGGGDGRGNFNIYRWEGAAGWVQKPGMAARIDVDPNGVAWVVNQQNAIFRWSGAGWSQIPGGAQDIGIGGDGSIWIVGTDRMIWTYNGSGGWTPRNARLVQVTVDEHGNPWGVDGGGQLVRGEAEGKRVVQGGTVWVVRKGTEDTGFFPVEQLPEGRWVFGADGTLREVFSSTCLSVPDGPSGSGYWRPQAKRCDGSSGTRGWSYRAADRTIRKSAHPNGCIKTQHGMVYFDLTCPMGAGATMELR